MPDGVASLERGRSFGVRYHRHVSTSPLLDAAQQFEHNAHVCLHELKNRLQMQNIATCSYCGTKPSVLVAALIYTLWEALSAE
jgi:hypothetical protein